MLKELLPSTLFHQAFQDLKKRHKLFVGEMKSSPLRMKYRTSSAHLPHEWLVLVPVNNNNKKSPNFFNLKKRKSLRAIISHFRWSLGKNCYSLCRTAVIKK